MTASARRSVLSLSTARRSRARRSRARSGTPTWQERVAYEGTDMKVTLIGGGSYQWAPNLISDMLQMPSLQQMHLVLEDIDPEPLPLMQKYATFAAEQLGANITVETTTDQREAVKDAF